eukprot:15348327-Ditylum_brightwellii.AAC.1
MTDDLTLDDLSMALESIASFSIESSAMQSFSLSSIELKNTEHNEQLDIVHEGNFYSVYCLKDSKGDRSIPSAHMAIKTINEMHGKDKYSSQMKNEFTISKHLALQCSSVRAAISHTEIGGLSAISLEWAYGTSLSEWTKHFHETGGPLCLTGDNEPNGINYHDKNIILQLAVEISNALAEIHNAGAIHNNLNPSHIIVETNKNGDNMTVKVIGLGSATLLTDLNGISSEIQKDLLSLGSILFEMFTGMCPLKEDFCNDTFSEGEENQSKMLLPQNQLISFLLTRVPLDIAKLILTLMKVEGCTPHFQSATDVARQLSSMLLNIDPNAPDFDAQTCPSGLKFTPGKLYGRDFHLSKLMDACSRIGTPDRVNMVFVSGYSGVGKSAVVQHVRKRLQGKKIHFISGKFEQLQPAGPLCALDAAFSEYTNSVIQKGPQCILETKKAIVDAIQADAGVLTDAFPCLCKIIGKPTTTPVEIGPMASQNRFSG